MAEVREEKKPLKRTGEHRLLILEIKAALHSFTSILPPVFMTMLLSAIIVLYITPDADENIEDSPAVVFNEDNADNGGEAAGFGLLNALILVGAITVMTFVIVLLIYLKCEKLFAAYLVVAIILLMGFTTSFMVLEGLETYEVPTDIITFSLFFYNYAVTGAIAIFSFEAGFQGPDRVIPYNITQTYLVLVSVVMAWLVNTIFPEATVWALLVLLAVYDLCAVLTPCGPLNCLIKVVTRRQEEAERNAAERGEEIGEGQNQMIPGLLYEVNTGKSKGMKRFRKKQENDAGAAGVMNFSIFMAFDDNSDKLEEIEDTQDQVEEDDVEGSSVEGSSVEEDIETTKVKSVEQIPAVSAPTPENDIETHEVQKIVEPESDVVALTEEEKQEKMKELLIKRAALEAKVLEELKQQSNLKLGLGDFVFYSVLTAKAAEFGFIAFVAVATCVLCGLCGTLILLSVFQKALPALPISIFIGVVTYLVVFALVSPLSDGMITNLAVI